MSPVGRVLNRSGGAGSQDEGVRMVGAAAINK
jgi:hypothetical protein